MIKYIIKVERNPWPRKTAFDLEFLETNSINTKFYILEAERVKQHAITSHKCSTYLLSINSLVIVWIETILQSGCSVEMLIFFLILYMETTFARITNLDQISLDLLIFFSFFLNGVICLLFLKARVSQHAEPS